MSSNGLIPNVEPISDDLRPVYNYDLIENYQGEGYAIFRARGLYAFGRRIDDIFYEVTGTDRIPLDWKPEIFAPIEEKDVGSYFFGL
ncbi:hypothetical protein [Sphingomonas montanisoli]|uniref:Uncharacterized protein n=1 Tax=Sphingomonas montanisoli TaxID=2606412 RepID=A0A5D9C9R2_9SPHN|nr:hypothetical protein [Sphingomonas montanisoli]TZG28063.1 hypothetical protein FYJ91_11100 [Sphingomonas montanisoli]